MQEPLRQIAIDSFRRGENEITAQLRVILSRVLERVVVPDDIEFRNDGNIWYSEIDDVRFRMRHVGTGWLTEVWSPASEWTHFESLSTLGAILFNEEDDQFGTVRDHDG